MFLLVSYIHSAFFTFSFLTHCTCSHAFLRFDHLAHHRMLVGRMNGGLDHRLFSSSDGISNDEDAEEEEDVWEDQEDSRTTSVKFTDDVQNEKTKEVGSVCTSLPCAKMSKYLLPS